VLWTTETAAGVGAPPMSYVVNGRQFVAVATGRAAGEPATRPGGAIRVFALPAP
jgi:glucose dehydrogenase